MLPELHALTLDNAETYAFKTEKKHTEKSNVCFLVPDNCILQIFSIFFNVNTIQLLKAYRIKF